MTETIQVKDIAIRLLTPNDTLDVRVFDIHGKMHPEIKRILLDEADFIYNRCLGDIEGLKLQDVYLTGSSAGYFYRDKSDLDMRIQVINEDCPYIVDDIPSFETFMSVMKNGVFSDTKFRVGNRFVDIKFGAHNFEIMGLYSILHDKWIIEPRKDIVDGLDIDDIMEEYTKRFYQIKDYMRHMLDSGKNKTLDGIEEIEQYYKNCIINSGSSIREYIIYKLLNYRGIHNQIAELFNDSLRDYLSLESEEYSPSVSENPDFDISYTLPPLYKIDI